ncbi:type II toxin-antitoxin system Rv0910 family toxin [Amycolatopsis sp. H20-H5]|uniref:type II toxin-antitoxin system Rv0910 family toxin n=1 Tax=Amycolatopsis sp. H20-H5 TaxID=3046309 RepID=UPI002DBBE278|nr:SRPBCC family protein [Amycolatopsis sp. H20-H5]MEC3977619.1 SRPBCC family protein [Amycolatopsis sp. H20-H5]
MAKVSVTANMPVSPARAWETASDLSRFGDWLTLHDGWRGQLPDEITVGTVLTSVVSVKGMRNRIDWSVGTFAPPELITLSGVGKAGVKVTLALAVHPAGDGSAMSIDAEFSAPGLFGPIGSAVGRALKGDLRTSLDRFAALAA